jgi:prepilin-type processing-associated H-X9-DG protein
VGPVIDPDPFLDEIDSRGWFGDDSIGEKGESGMQMTNRYFVCPSLADEFELDIRNGAYGYNYQHLGNSRVAESGDRWSNFPVGTNQIRASGRTVLIADSRGAGKVHGRHSYALDPPRLAVERGADEFGPGASDVQPGLSPELYQYSPVEMRHKDKGNVVFVDGHAEGMSLAELGYQLNDDGVAMPIRDPQSGTYTATNKLWNGQGYDEIARDHRP